MLVTPGSERVQGYTWLLNIFFLKLCQIELQYSEILLITDTNTM